MQIAGLPNLPIASNLAQRPDASERLQREQPRESNRTEDQREQIVEQGQQTSQSQEVIEQRVESPDRTNETQTRRQAEDENLPLNTRRALQAFAENTPSPEQQLGIELAGIDVFA